MQKQLAYRITDLPGCQPQIQAAITAFVQRVAAEYPDLVLSVILYGSQARGEAENDSDIDLFIVIRQDSPSLREALADLAWQVQFEHNVVISDVIRSADQWHQMQTKRFPYFRSIEREGILLWKNTSKPMLAYA